MQPKGPDSPFRARGTDSRFSGRLAHYDVDPRSVPRCQLFKFLRSQVTIGDQLSTWRAKPHCKRETLRGNFCCKKCCGAPRREEPLGLASGASRQTSGKCTAAPGPRVISRWFPESVHKGNVLHPVIPGHQSWTPWDGYKSHQLLTPSNQRVGTWKCSTRAEGRGPMMDVLTIIASVVVGLAVVFYFFRTRHSQFADHVKQLFPGAGARKPSAFTRQEVAKHSSRDDAWIIIKGRETGRYGVYDVTSYVEEHPGGDAILDNAGGDATTGFYGPQHPPRAFDLIGEFYIGELIDWWKESKWRDGTLFSQEASFTVIDIILKKTNIAAGT